VVTGNPEDGWTLANWDGIAVAAEPSLPTKLFVDVRDVVTAPQTAAYRIGQAFAAGDIAGVAKAIRDGVVDVATKVVGFVPKVVSDVVGSLRPSAAVQSVKAATATEAPKPTKVATKTKKSNGATDLTGGNKVEPGDTAAATAHDTTKSETPKDVTEPVAPAREDTTSAADTADKSGDESTGSGGADQEAA
jgi:hypothetical protein